MKTFAAVGYLAYLGLSCSYYQNYRICRFNNNTEVLVKGCNIFYMTYLMSKDIDLM